MIYATKVATKDAILESKVFDFIKRRVLVFWDEKPMFREWGERLITEASLLFDFRSMFTNVEGLSLASELFWDIYESDFPFQIAVVELWTVPLLGALLMEWKKRGKIANGLILRKSRKKSGLCNIIEGDPNSERIILVDDIINTTESFRRNLAILEENIFAPYKSFLFLSIDSISDLSKKLENIHAKTRIDIFSTLDDYAIARYEHRIIPPPLPYINPSKTPVLQLPEPNNALVFPKSNPLVTQEMMYIAWEGGKIFALDRKTLETKWEFSIHLRENSGDKRILSSPIMIEDFVVIGAYNGNLYFLDSKTGQEKASLPIADWIGSSIDYSSEHRIIYVWTEHYWLLRGGLKALHIDSKEVVWEQPFLDYVHGSPLYIPSKNIVACGSNGGTIGAFDAKNGNLFWMIKLPKDIKGRLAFIPSNQILIAASTDGNIYGVDVNTGTILWSVSGEFAFFTTPLIFNDEIFIGWLDKKLYHLSATGEVINIVETGGRIFSQCFADNQWRIVFWSNDMKIRFYDPKKKDVVSLIHHGERIVSQPVIFDTTLYVFDSMNRLYKYDLSGY